MVDFVRKKRRKTRNLTKICESILDAIIAEPSDTTGNGRDNCTISKGSRACVCVCVEGGWASACHQLIQMSFVVHGRQ